MLGSVCLGHAAERKYVVLDVSQSQAKPGTVSSRGEHEWTYNRMLAVDLQAVLRARGYLTSLVMVDDSAASDMSVKDRVRAFEGAHLVVSLAHEPMPIKYYSYWSAPGRRTAYTDKFSGYSISVSRHAQNPDGVICASAVGMALRLSGFKPSGYLLEQSGFGDSSRLVADKDGPVYFNDLSLLMKIAPNPIFTVETAVIQNPDDEILLKKADYRKGLVTAIANGIDACLTL